MITKQHVITATHCLRDNSTSIFVDVNGHGYPADRVFKAPYNTKIGQFGFEGLKDLSILKLRQIPLGCIIPICLPKNTTENLMVNGNLTLASYQNGKILKSG